MFDRLQVDSHFQNFGSISSCYYLDKATGYTETEIEGYRLHWNYNWGYRLHWSNDFSNLGRFGWESPGETVKDITGSVWTRASFRPSQGPKEKGKRKLRPSSATPLPLSIRSPPSAWRSLHWPICSIHSKIISSRIRREERKSMTFTSTCSPWHDTISGEEIMDKGLAGQKRRVKTWRAFSSPIFVFSARNFFFYIWHFSATAGDFHVPPW